MTTLRQRMIDDFKPRNRLPRTVETYVWQGERFAKHFKRSPTLLGAEEVRACEACPRSAGKHRVACPLPVRPRVRSWLRNHQPVRMTVAPRPSFRRFHPGRDRSTHVLAETAGTILLSGPLLTMASFGTPRGHSLSVGPQVDCSCARTPMDAHPRTKLVSRYCASAYPLFGG